MSSKIQQRTLSNLRTILRHIRNEFDAAAPFLSSGFLDVGEKKGKGEEVSSTSPLAATAASASSSSSISTPISQLVGDAKFRQTPLFSNFVISQYKANRVMKDKTRARELRDHAADVVSYLEALKAQENILRLSRGVDPDRPLQRQAVARMVGFEMPKVSNEALNASTAARSPEEVAEPYLLNVKERISTGDAANRLTGVENLKAQYYGVNIPEAIANAAAGKKDGGK
jgi:hypothetical protein